MVFESRSAPEVVFVKLRSDPEGQLNKPHVPDYIALRQPPDLPLPDHVHRLVACDSSQRTIDGSEPEAGRNPLPDETVILLQYIVQVGRRPALAAAAQLAARLQVGDRWRIRCVPVHVDYPWS